MGAIFDGDGRKKKYYDLNGQDKCLYTRIDGVKTKVIGIQGWLQDIQLKHDLDKKGKLKEQYLFSFSDNPNPTEEEEFHVVCVTSGTYHIEKIFNMLLSVDQPHQLKLFVYKSDSSENIPGVSIKIGDQSLEYFYKWNDQTRKVDGIPEGKPDDDVRMNFWKDKVFGNIYQNFFNRDWAGDILIGKNLKEHRANNGTTTTSAPAEPTYSPGALRAINQIKNKLPVYEENQNAESLANAWKEMLEYLKANSKPGDEKLVEDTMYIVQASLDSIPNSKIKLKEDGTWEEEDDLPF